MSAGFEKLEVWQLAMRIVPRVYRLSQKFPRDERFGLTSQIRRAAVSVPSNVAEGHARHGRREFRRFVSTAQGSLAEVLTQLYLAAELEYVETKDIADLLAQVHRLGRMLNGLRQSLISNLQSPKYARIHS